MVSSGAVLNAYVERSRPYPHDIEALVFPLSKRHEQSPRNETISLVSSATTWAIHTSSVRHSPKVIQYSTTPALPSDTVSIVVTASTQRSYHISGSLPSEPARPSRTENVSASSQSTTSVIVTSQRSSTSTTGHQLSTSSFLSSSSSQQSSFSIQSPSTTSSNLAAIQESLASRSSSSSNLQPTKSNQIPSFSAISISVSSQNTSQSTLASLSSTKRDNTISAASRSGSHVIASSTGSVNLPATPVSEPSFPRVISSSHGSSTSPFASIASAGTLSSIPAATLTSQHGNLQTLSTSPFSLGNHAMSTSNSNFTPPMVSSTAPVANNTTTMTLSPTAPSREEISTYVGTTEAWSLTSSSIVSSPTFVLPSTRAGNLTFALSATLSKPTLVLTSSNGFVSTSESTNSSLVTTSHSAVATLLNAKSSGIFYTNALSTGVISKPSDVARSSSLSPTENLSSTVSTKTATLGALSISTHTVPSPGTSMGALPVSRMTSSTNYTTVLKPPSVSNSQKIISPSLLTASIVTILVNTTSVVASQSLIQSASSYQGWNSSAQLYITTLTKRHSGTASLTRFNASPEETRLQAPSTLLVLSRSNLTTSNTVLNVPPAINSTSSTGSLGQTTSHQVSSSSTLSTSRSYGELPRTVTATVSSTGSATGSAAALPPLTTSQTAGVAIAGTAGLLFAVVAAIYITRRYHAKRARHASIGSIYPKVAYLYDPSTDGRGGDDGPEEAFMSGGSSGIPLDEHISIAPPKSPGYGQRCSPEMLSMRFSDPGNPFRDPEDSSRYSNDSIDISVHTPTNTKGAFAGAIRGYSSVAQKTPTTADLPVSDAVRDVTWPSPARNPIMSEESSTNRSSILGDIASMVYNPNVNSRTTSLRYQPLSQYGFHSSHSLPCVRETTYTESIRDPFEHDLLLQVDTRTETPDFVTVYAPSTTSVQPEQTALPIKVLSNNPWASSLLNPNTSKSTPRSNSRQVSDTAIAPHTTMAASERCSLGYNNRTSTTYIAPSQQQVDNTISPISPPLGAMHRGWDDIKRYSVDKVVPTTSNLSPPLGYMNSSPIKKKSIPQLRRKELASASSRESILSHARLPLTVKIPFAHNKSSSTEIPKMSQLVPRVRSDDDMKSPDSTFSHSVHSLASMMYHKKKGGDMEFSCAGVR